MEEQGFTFNVVKTYTLTVNKLGILGVPHLLVFDKNKRLIQNSNIQFVEKRFIINNIYLVIDKLLEE
jgi:hypothetical protein